jgi:hypothetical protein
MPPHPSAKGFPMRLSGFVAAALLLTACGGGDGPTDPKVGHPHFVKLSGDHQSSLVRGFHADRMVDRGTLRLAVAAPGDSLFAEPLIGIMEALPQAQAVRFAGRGDVLPANTVVQWAASDPNCARPYLVTTLPGVGDSIVNRAIRGTKAGDCVIYTQTLIGTTPVEADSFSFHVDPGPASPTYDTGDQPSTNTDSVVIPAKAVQDAYGNSVPFTIGAPADTMPLTLSGNVVHFTGQRDANGRWFGNGGTSGLWRLPLMTGGTQSGTLTVVAYSGLVGMTWKAKGLSTP